ncbi:hypothetical protein LCGC14_0879890 [marine sediment metagenome]|uniref:Uncharacterized protein n=1 Tax=marine sediment metagenome TaxID=412755 RepID=A0A0F9PMV1_9ZZZZ
MSSIQLGLTGGEITLPVLRYVGSAPGLPTTIEPQTEEAIMSDGNKRWAFFESKYQWTLSWGYLTYGELTNLITLVNTKQVLHYRNNWVSTTWYDVVIVSFSYEFIRPGIKKYKRFRADMTLREA